MRRYSTIPVLWAIICVYGLAVLPPEIVITSSPSSPVVGQTVTLNGSASYDPDGTIVSYSWTLPGQAFCMSGINTSIAKCKFDAAGTYTVTLTAKDNEGLYTSEDYQVTITAATNTVWYVRTDGSDDNSGSVNSSSGAFRTIQTAIDSASTGDQIRVYGGIYYEQLHLKGKDVSIYSYNPTNPGSWELAENTIIDANKQGTAVRYGGAESNSAELKGFTVRGGFPTGDSLALHLEFDDLNTIALDCSGKERNGIINGDPNRVAGYDGLVNGALEFNGNDRIQIEGYKGVAGKHPRSCAMWVKTSTVNTEMVLVSWGKEITGQKWQFIVSNTNKLAVGIWGGRVEGTRTITDGNWHHVAAVFEGNGAINIRDIKLYVDGVQESTTCSNYVTIPPDVNTELDGTVYIGARTGETPQYYTGVIDDVRIYSRTLGDGEVKIMSQAPVSLVHLKLDGNASDASGNQHFGTVEGDPNWINSGRIYGALDLDGAGDYITLSEGVLNPAATAFSVFTWVRPEQETLSTYQAIIQQFDEGTNLGRTLLLRTTDNKLSSSLGGSSTTTSQAIFTQADQWYHIGVTYDGQKVTLYVNGQEVVNSYKTAESCNGGWIIGRHKTDTTTCWNGAIDDFQIYKRVLSLDEIRQIAGHQEPVVHWTMDSISGSTISDNTLYNRSGIFSVASPTSTCSDGRLDNAISLQNNEYIRISGWNGIAGGSSRTTTAWVKTTPIPTVSPMVYTWGNSANGEKWMFRVEPTGQIALGVWGGYVSGTTIVADGNWHHVAAVLNSDGTPTVGEVQLYVDGRLETVTSTNPSQAIITSNAENVLIGTRHESGSYYNYYTGGLDDIRIYDRPLSQKEIQGLAGDIGLMAHWTLDETSSPCADSSGNAIPGTWGGTPTSSMDGYLAGAMEFDGVSDYISTNYNGVLGNRDRTVSAWIKAIPDNSIILRTIVAWGGTAIGGSWNLAVNYVSGEGPSGTIRIAANSSKVIGTTPVDDNRWHHVAVVFANDGTPTVSDIQLYIDGKREVLSYSVDATLNTGTGYNVNIGAMRYQTNDPIFFFKGKIDDVRIYDRALSDVELWQMYQTSVGGGIQGHGTSASIEKCIIKGNQSLANGGGISFTNGMLKNTLLIDNQSGQNGGGIAYSYGTIQNCTLANNCSISGGGLYGCNGDIVNSILWNNTPDQVADCNDIRFSCIQNWNEGGTGNIGYNPCFTDPSQDNYSLLSYSPSIDAGCDILNDPASDYLNEPEDNGDRVNMGYLGNTTSAEIADRITDSDYDGLTDYQEILYGTERLIFDTDGDGISDGWEVNYSLNPLDPNDAQLDSDADGLTNIQEYYYGTNPLDSDTDEDGMSDAWEVAHGLNALYSGDKMMDYDGDGLTNHEECLRGTDPCQKDSDDDGLNDGLEVQWYLDPVDPNDAGYDLDNDGYSNIAEYIHASDPNDPNSLCVSRTIVVPTEVTTIQKAVSWSIDGDKIVVLQGVYHENVVIEDKDVVVQSSDPNNPNVVKSTVIDGQGNWPLLLLNCGTSTKISGLTLQNGNYGVWVSNGDSAIEKCIIQHNSTFGIYLQNQSAPLISHNIIHLNGEIGILSEVLCSPAIRNNIIYGNTYGISLIDAGGAKISNNTIFNNKAYGIISVGTAPVSKNNIIWNNTNDLVSCPTIYSCISDQDAGIGNIFEDPNFINVFDFVDKTNADGTQTTICVADASRYAVGDVIEYNDDNISRIVTDVNSLTNTVAFSNHPMDANSVSGIYVFNWGSEIRALAEDYHIQMNSPCIDAGDPNDNYAGQWDIDYEPRMRGKNVDIGADETPVVWYVDHDANGLNTGYSWQDAFPSIQQAIDTASEGDQIVISEGIYAENITIPNRSIILQGLNPNNWQTVENTVIQSADPNYPALLILAAADKSIRISGLAFVQGYTGVSIYNGAAPVFEYCAFKDNLSHGIEIFFGSPVFRYCQSVDNTGLGVKSYFSMAEFVNCLIVDNALGGVQGEIARIENCTIVSNQEFGVSDCDGTIRNCILWNNGGKDLINSTATYTCVQQAIQGIGNINWYPYFAAAGQGDYHLASYSPCVNAGDPNSAFVNEPNSIDNRIDMGWYGNTLEATIPSPDSDGDDLPDLWETMYWTSCQITEGMDDYDLDQLSNISEYHLGTDPNDLDTDNDGMSDGWEVRYTLNPLYMGDAPEDADGDGLTNLQEYTLATNPLLTDTDSDGMPDGWEVQYTLNPLVNDAADDLDLDGLTNLQEYQLGTNPNDSDTDNDGISDDWELSHGLNPNDMDDASDDLDGDGLTNLEEYLAGLDMDNIDSDGDGISDSWEYENGLNPLDSSDKEADLDADGYSNYVEYLHASDPNDPSSALSNIQIIVPTQSSTIQQAIDWSIDGDSVKILPGIYVESVNYNGKLITLTGIDPNDWTTTANTVIDGTVSAPAVRFISGENQSAVLEGLSIISAPYGISCSSGSSPTIHRCIIENNSSHGIFVSDGSPTISNCMIDKNGGSGYRLDSGNVNIKGCWIYRNSGSGISIVSSSGGIIGYNTIANNTQCGVIFTGDPNDSNVMPPQIANNIIWSNGGSSYSDLQGCSAEYCCISDGGTGTNIDDNPLFFNATDDNYLLEKESPCIDAGDPNTICDSNEKDILGQVRMAERIDMGADEVCTIWNLTQNRWHRNSIQEAIDEAEPNDVIQLYEWVFQENINYSGKNITLRSTDPNNWSIIENTRIESIEPNLAVVTFDNNEGIDSIITGVTIEGGPWGIRCENSSPSIMRCNISNNEIGIVCLNSAPQIMRNKISYNGNGQGAGIVVDSNIPPVISGNMIYKNDNGIMYLNSVSGGTVFNNTLAYNYSIDSNNTGTGIYVDPNAADPNIVKCVLWANEMDLIGCQAAYSCLTDPNLIDPNSTNISEDPLFQSIEEDAYYLSSESPCLYAFSEVAVPMSVGLEGDMIVCAGAASTSILYVTGQENGVKPPLFTEAPWTNTYANLQDAIADAKPGYEIWVKEGTYFPDRDRDNSGQIGIGDRSKSFTLKPNVSIYGGFAGTESSKLQRQWMQHPTILSGDINGTLSLNTDNSYHVVTANNTDNTACLDGFYITGGYSHDAPTRGGYRPYPEQAGAGLQNMNASPTVQNCVFTQNIAGTEGGGAVSNWNSYPTFNNCVFERNQSQYYGTAIQNYYCSTGNITVNNCIFRDNYGLYASGALYNGSASICTVLNSIFADNKVRYGGGIYNSASSSIINSVFKNNYSVQDGGAVCNWNGSADIRNCTFVGNDADYRGGAVFNFGTNTVYITNSILWGNTDNYSGNDEIRMTGSYTTVRIRNSNIRNAFSSGVWDSSLGQNLAGNIAQDPDFANGNYLPEGKDGIWGTKDDGLYLSSNSPCRDTGDKNYILASQTTDAGGRVRIQDGQVDMGAYEGGWPIVPSIQQSTVQGQELIFTLPAINVYGDTLSYIQCSEPQQGQVIFTNNLSGTTVTYTPKSNLSFSQNYIADTFLYTISDGAFVGQPATITIHIQNKTTDSEGDTLPDWWETKYDLDPSSNDSDNNGIPDKDENPDDDGLTNAKEYEYGTNPNVDDTDGDSIKDGDEVGYDGNASAYNPYDPVTNRSGTDLNALKKDTDGDKISDNYEVAWSNDGKVVNPLNPDTDGDGLDDGIEVSYYQANDYTRYDPYLSGTTYKTKDLNANKSDTDSDGICDAWEVKYSIGEDEYERMEPRQSRDGCNPPNEYFKDIDDDGMTNWQEYTYVDNNGNTPNPQKSDSDFDGLKDGEEWPFYLYKDHTNAWVMFELNPINPDTDGDGLIDGLDDIPVGGQLVYPNGVVRGGKYLADNHPGLPDADPYITGSGSSQTIYPDRFNDGWERKYSKDGGLTEWTWLNYWNLSSERDSDKDGLTDHEEEELGTDPHDNDMDNDGLLDKEDHAINGINSIDTDSDGLVDGYDGYISKTEYPEGVDGDGDGWVDGEKGLGTMPDYYDTDGDFLEDGWEVKYGLDPLTSNRILTGTTSHTTKIMGQSLDWIVPGKIGNALQLSNLPHTIDQSSNEFDLPTTTGYMSLAFWVNTGSGTGDIWTKLNADSSSGYGVRLRSRDLQTFIKSNGEERKVQQMNLPTNKWIAVIVEFYNDSDSIHINSAWRGINDSDWHPSSYIYDLPIIPPTSGMVKIGGGSTCDLKIDCLYYSRNGLIADSLQNSFWYEGKGTESFSVAKYSWTMNESSQKEETILYIPEAKGNSYPLNLDNTTLINGMNGMSPGFAFNGINDYISLDTTETQVVSNLSKFSLGGWFKFNTNGNRNEGLLVSKNAGVVTSGLARTAAGALNVRIGGQDFIGPMINNQNWHFVMAVFDGSKASAERLAIYVDNQQAVNCSTAQSLVSLTEMQIGGNDAVGGSGLFQYFSGNVDNVMLFNDALMSSDVQSLYTKGIEGDEIIEQSSLVAQYRMDQRDTSNTINNTGKFGHTDSDKDGIDDFEEQRQGTNPKDSDSDGDGMSDEEELGQGTDPTSDKNKRTVEIALEIGDPSGSHSEKYRLQCGNRSHQSRSFGKVERASYLCQIGDRYCISIKHLANDKNAECDPRPDYDYKANLYITGALPEGVVAYVEDPKGILKEHTCPDENDEKGFYADGKKAWLVITEGTIPERDGISPLSSIDPNNVQRTGLDCKGGEPISANNGEFTLDTRDFTLSGRALSVIFERHYCGKQSGESPFGYGWDMNYNQKLYRQKNQAGELEFIVLFDGNHGRKKYVVDSQNISRLNPVTQDGSYMEIQSNNTVRIVYQNGSSKGFDVSDMLSYIKDKYGNQISFAYTFVKGNRLLETITDDLGRDVSLSYNDRGLLKEVRDFTGRSWIYSYDDTRNWLRQVTMPGTPEYPAGLTTTYSYQGEDTPETDDDKPWIKTVKDPENQTYIDNTYDSDGWVIDQVYGDKHFRFSYDPWHNMFTETDRNNVTTIKYYDDYGSTLAEGILASTPQKRSGDPFCYLTQYSYDTNRRLIQTVSPSGSTVDLAYDDYGNLLTLTETGYNADYSISARSTSYEYTGIDYYNLVRSATDFAGNKVLYEYDFDQPGYGTQIGNLMKITYPAVMTPDGMQQPEVAFKYNTDNQVKEILSPDKVKTTLQYYDEDIAAHWTMDDNADDTFVADKSGKGNHGNCKYQNTSTMHTDGKVRGALSFDGSNYIEVSSSSSLSIGTQDFTIMGWVKPTAPNTKRYLISNQDAAKKGYAVYLTKENKLTAEINDGTVSQTLSTGVLYQAWNFFAVVFDRDNSLKIYLNNNSTPTMVTMAVPGDLNNNQALLIGGASSEYFIDGMDDVRIYRRCLSYDEEIKPIYLAGLYNTNLKGFWKADDNAAGPQVADASGADLHGTFVGLGGTDDYTLSHSTSGKIGQSLELDGQNDGIICPHNENLNQAATIAISAWINVDNGPHIGQNRQMIVSKSDASLITYAFFVTQDVQPRLGFTRGDGSIEILSNTPIALQKWVKVEAVVNNNSCTLLINGLNAGSGSLVAGSINSKPVTIGCSLSGNTMVNCFDGKIDNVMLFDAALYAAQLNAFSIRSLNELNRGRLKSVVVDPEDKKIQVDYEYDLVGNVTAVVDPVRNTSEMFYNNLNQLIEMTSALGAKTTFSYNRNKKLSEVKSQAKDTFDPEDPETYQRTEYAYNLLDKLQKVTDATGYSSYLEYDNNDNVKSVIDPMGAGTTYTGPGTTPLYKTGYEYDERNLLWKETDAQNAVTEYSYDLDGNVKSIKDAKSKYTYYQYDAFGNVSRITYEMYPNSGNTRTESFDYDINGNLIQYIKNPGNLYNEQKTTYQYDALGRMVSRKLPNKPTEDYLYGIAGRLVSITPRLEDTSLGSYIKGYWKLDDCADTKTVSDSSGAARNGTAQKNTSALYTPGQYCGAFIFNATDMDYIAVPYSAPLSDITGNITLSAWIKPTMIAGQNRIIIQTGSGNYWPYKLEISSSDNKLRFSRGNGTTIQGYASTGTLSLNQWVHVAVTVSGWSYAFYINGAPSGSGSFTFWAASQMNDVFIGGAGGNYFNGQMDEVMVLNRALTSSEIQTIFVHSATDKVEYDRIGRPSKTTDLNDCTVGYTYNKNSAVETLTYPDNSTVRYEYDAQNRLEYIKEGEIILARYTYDTLSRRTSVQYNTSRDSGNNPTYESKTTYTYKDSERIGLSDGNQLGNWLAKVANDINNDGTADITFEYGYDKAGNRITMDTTAAGNQGLHTYNYDNLYQLTSAVYQSNWGWADISNIAYDSVFNRTTYTPAIGSPTSYTINNYSAVNQYTTIDSTGITYDYNGNLTYGGQYVGAGSYTYVYDAQNRLIEVKDGSTSKFTYTYDTFGRRVSKPKSATDDTVLSFCYAGGRILAEYENGILARKYIYGPGIDEVICLIDTAAGARYYYFYDGLGSVAALSNANNAIIEAYCYDAFGRTKINTTAGPDGNWLTPDGTPAAASGYGNRFMFTGREYDSETDLYSCRARMYSPALGRFLQPDPIGYADSMNLYQYCGNNPINWIDPWGLATLGIAADSTGNFNGHSWLIYTDDDGRETTYGLWHNSVLGNGGAGYDSSEQSVHGSALGVGSGYIGATECSGCGPIGMSSGGSAGSSLGSSSGSSSSGIDNDYEKFRAVPGGDLYKDLEGQKGYGKDCAEVYTVPLTDEQNQKFLDLVKQQYNFNLYFGIIPTNNCTSWASDIFEKTTGIGIDPDGLLGFETPYELADNIRHMNGR